MSVGIILTHSPVLSGCYISIFRMQEAVPRLANQFLSEVAEVVDGTEEDKRSGVQPASHTQPL